jgi:hypothetical protein
LLRRDAQRRTGHHVGGISPFGQKRLVPTALDASAADRHRVFVNGGQRGLQLELRPDDIVAVLQPIVAALTGYKGYPRNGAPATQTMTINDLGLRGTLLQQGRHLWFIPKRVWPIVAQTGYDAARRYALPSCSNGL